MVILQDNAGDGWGIKYSSKHLLRVSNGKNGKNEACISGKATL